MTTKEAIAALAEKYPDRYFSITAAVHSHAPGLYREHRESNPSISVYVENVDSFEAATLAEAVAYAIGYKAPATIEEVSELVAENEKPDVQVSGIIVKDIDPHDLANGLLAAKL